MIPTPSERINRLLHIERTLFRYYTILYYHHYDILSLNTSVHPRVYRQLIDTIPIVDTLLMRLSVVSTVDSRWTLSVFEYHSTDVKPVLTTLPDTQFKIIHYTDDNKRVSIPITVDNIGMRNVAIGYACSDGALSEIFNQSDIDLMSYYRLYVSPLLNIPYK